MDFRDIQKKFGGKYVVVLNDNVVAQAETYNAALDRARELHLTHKTNLAIRFIHHPRLRR